MSKEQLQPLIDSILYDIETIRILRDCGRLKETLPTVFQILFNIHAIQEKIAVPNSSLKECFANSFWKKEFQKDCTFEDFRAKVEKIINEKTPVSDQELESMRYDLFLENLSSWAFSNIQRLKRQLKSPLQKKLELFLPILAIIIAIGCISITKFLTQDWGLRADYYKGMNFEKYIGSGFSKNINFGSVEDMGTNNTQMNNVSIRWQGVLLSPKDGNYVLSVVMDDGARLFIDGTLLIDQWRDSNSPEISKSIFLKKGPHQIRLDYYNRKWGGVLRLYWKPEGKTKEIIPAQFLRQKDL